MIRGMARLMRSLLTGVSFRVNIDRTRCMGKGSTAIQMDRPTMENGKITSTLSGNCILFIVVLSHSSHNDHLIQREGQGYFAFIIICVYV